MEVLEKPSQKKQKKRRGRMIAILVSVVVLAAVSLTAAELMTNGGRFSVRGFKNLFTGAVYQAKAQSFAFETGGGGVFANMDGGLAVVSATGLQVFDQSAREVFDETFDMKTPTLCSGGQTCAAYDMGGTTLCVFDAGGVKKRLTTDGKIISVSVNKNGYLALSTQQSGYKGLVTVYDPGGNEIYKWFSAAGYVLAAEVSPDNKGMAALTLDDSGSRVVLFSLGSTDEKASCSFENEVVLGIRYFGSSSVLAIGSTGATLVGADGKGKTLQDYSGKNLAAFSVSDDLAALVVHDYAVGEKGSILTLDKSGEQLAKMDTERRILSVSANGKYLAVLYGDGLVIYDRKLDVCGEFSATTGATETIMRSDGTALLLTAHSATVCKAITPSK